MWQTPVSRVSPLKAMPCASSCARAASTFSRCGDPRELYSFPTRRSSDLSARTLVTLVTPGSCFAGTLAELVLAADRSFMLDGTFEDADDDLPPAELVLTDANDNWYSMSNGLTRLQSRFWGHDAAVEAVRASLGKHL